MRFACWSVLMVLLATPASAGEVRVVAPLALGQVDVEIVSSAEGAQAGVVGRLGPGAALTLADGDYWARLGGTDHCVGPIRVESGSPASVALGALRLIAPSGAGRATHFAIDPVTGSVAARLSTDRQAVPILAGSYELRGDLSQVPTPIDVPPGRTLEVSLGALVLDTPSGARDMSYFVLTDETAPRVVAYARLSQGPIALQPGRVRVCRERSGTVSEPVDVVVGRTARVPCALLRVHSFGADRALDVGVVRTTDALLAFRARDSGAGEVIFPGEYSLSSWAQLVAAERAGKQLGSVGDRFVALPGRTTTFWLDETGVYPDCAGEVPVDVTGLLEGRRLSSDRPLHVRVVVAEPCTVELNLVDLRPGRSASVLLQASDARPPGIELDVDMKDLRLDPGARLVLEATATSDGSTRRGRTAPMVVVVPRARPVTGAHVRGAGTTWIELAWTPVLDAVGYRLYRAGAMRPIVPEPIRSSSFKDTGLTAGRTYGYELCALDEQGLEGPRVPLEGRTPWAATTE